MRLQGNNKFDADSGEARGSAQYECLISLLGQRKTKSEANWPEGKNSEEGLEATMCMLNAAGLYACTHVQ